MANCEDLLNELRDELVSSDETSEREELWRHFVNTYIDCSGHPEQSATSDQEIEDLAAAIHDYFGASLVGITEANTAEQLFALALAKENPSRDTAARNVEHGADPVMMFNGQFVHHTTDITISGAGVDFIFERTYKNQISHRGPIGHNWDHNLNLWLRLSNQTIFRSTGDLREEAYSRHPKFGESGFSYWVPPDGQDGIIIENGSSFIWRAPNGVKHFYEQDTAHPFLHRVSLIEDRHGNYLAVRYQGDRIHQVEINHLERIVEFSYDAEDRINTVQDYTGRIWQYCYDFFGDLVSFTMPGTDRYPEGLTVSYEYSSAQFTGELQHNLTRIIDAAGQMYLENEYGLERGILRFNRVIRQRQGGGDFLFEYENVVEDFDFDYSEAERPAHQTVLVERNGQPVRHTYNKFGNLILREECVIINGLHRDLVWRYRYNRDGLLIASLTPEGVVTQNLYGREDFARKHGIDDEGTISAHEELTGEERQAFGRLLATVRRGAYFGLQHLNLARGVWGDIFPDIFGGTDPADIVTKFTYEAVYGQALTVSDPRTTERADPQHVESIAYEQGLTRFEYDGPPGDPTRLLRRIRRPQPSFPDGTLAAAVVEEFTDYDSRGRLKSRIDPVDIITSYEYFGADSGRSEGHLHRTVLDPGGLAIITEYDVDDLGRVIALHLPRSVGAPPGQFVTERAYNELDQITRVTTAPPFTFEIRRFYDRNGKLEREERDAKNEAGFNIADAPEIRTYAYDEELNPVCETIGGANRSAHLVTHHCYDAAGRRVTTILPAGNTIHYAYDERGLVVAQTLGAGTLDTSTTRSDYDGDGRLRRSRSARGSATTITLDPFGRTTAKQDALGNVIRSSYDKAGNLVVERVFERREDGSFVLIARTESEYDVLGRVIRIGTNRFEEPLLAGDLDVDFLLSPGPGTLISTQTFYDSKGRVIRTVDPLGRIHASEYNAFDSITASTDPMGNRVENHYDVHGNLTRKDVRDLVRDPVTDEITGERVFSSDATYDELDRRVTDTDSLGNITHYGYDSRANLTRRADPLGNIVRTEFDIFGRYRAEIRERTTTGLGGGDPQPPCVTKFEYDANGNRILVVDPFNRQTMKTYDELDRRRKIIYPDGSEFISDYDVDGNLVRTTDNNGLQRHYTVDALGRTKRVEVDRSKLLEGIIVEGASFEQYSYDALHRTVIAENDFVRCETRFDSLSRAVADTMTFITGDAPLLTPFVISRKYNEAGGLTDLTYPNGRRLHFDRDDLDRLTAVRNLFKGTNYPGNTETADIHDVLTRIEYAGRQRMRCRYGNGTTTVYAHDGAGRLVEIDHASTTEPLVKIQYLFDAVGNVRIRNDIHPSSIVKEAFAYDGLYRLVNEDHHSRALFDPLPLAPATFLAPDPIPTRQIDIDVLIGSLELPPQPHTYKYDLVGNRRLETDGSEIQYNINPLDQYIEIENVTADEATHPKYDFNGNLKDDGQRTYTYDSLNRLVRVVEAGAPIAEFRHDVRGRRILEFVNGTVTQLISDGENLIGEYRDGMLFAQYVHGAEVDQPLEVVAEGNEHWYHCDIVGSVRILTDPNGATAVSYVYAPFGETSAPADGPFNPLRFTAHRLDEHLGTYDGRARQYDPILGRFLQRDPAGMKDGTNLYVYVGNNPIAFLDPFGMERREWGSDSEPGSVLDAPANENALTVWPSLAPAEIDGREFYALPGAVPDFGSPARGPVVFWTGLPPWERVPRGTWPDNKPSPFRPDLAQLRAERLASSTGGTTLTTSPRGLALQAMGVNATRSMWRQASAVFAFWSGFEGRPKTSVVAVSIPLKGDPKPAPPVRTAVEIPSYNVGKVTGAFVRSAPAGVRFLGHAQTFFSAIRLADMIEGRTEVELDASPGDFEVGHEFPDVYIGRVENGNYLHATIRVERNFIGRKKFYIVDLREMI